MISKCVLHLLVIQTLDDILKTGPNDIVYKTISTENYLELVLCLEKSYRFAKAFNAYQPLRTALYRMGYMKQVPNLLKQETLSVSALIRYLFKMTLDKDTARLETRKLAEDRLIP